MIELTDLLKVYGPLSLGWVFFGVMLKVFLDRNKEDIDARVKLAIALETLTAWIKERGNHA